MARFATPAERKEASPTDRLQPPTLVPTPCQPKEVRRRGSRCRLDAVGHCPHLAALGIPVASPGRIVPFSDRFCLVRVLEPAGGPVRGAGKVGLTPARIGFDEPRLGRPTMFTPLGRPPLARYATRHSEGPHRLLRPDQQAGTSDQTPTYLHLAFAFVPCSNPFSAGPSSSSTPSLATHTHTHTRSKKEGWPARMSGQGDDENCTQSLGWTRYARRHAAAAIDGFLQRRFCTSYQPTQPTRGNGQLPSRPVGARRLWLITSEGGGRDCTSLGQTDSPLPSHHRPVQGAAPPARRTNAIHASPSQSTPNLVCNARRLAEAGHPEGSGCGPAFLPSSMRRATL